MNTTHERSPLGIGSLGLKICPISERRENDVNQRPESRGFKKGVVTISSVGTKSIFEGAFPYCKYSSFLLVSFAAARAGVTQRSGSVA